MNHTGGQDHLAVHEYFRKLYNDEKQKQDDAKQRRIVSEPFETWQPFRGSNKNTGAHPILAYSKELACIKDDAPAAVVEMVASWPKMDNVEETYKKTPCHIGRGRRKIANKRTYHIFIPSSLDLFEQALSQLSPIFNLEATPVQNGEQAISKDAVSTVTRQINIECESPEISELEVAALKRDIEVLNKDIEMLETRVTAQNLNIQQLQNENKILKKKQGNNAYVKPLEEYKSKRERRYFHYHEDDYQQIKRWVDFGFIKKESDFFEELHEYMQLHVDEAVRRFELDIKFRQEGWLP